MTLAEMYDTLRARLQPRDKDRVWTPLELVHLLNRAQRVAVARLEHFMVPELVNSATSQSPGGASGFDLTGLSPALFNGRAGIISIKHSGGYYCEFLTDAQRRENSDNQVTYDYTAPKYWIIGNTLYVNPYSGYTFDITYKAAPTDMALETLTFTYAPRDPAVTTGFAGDDDQGLSAVDSAYVGAVLYLRTKASHHVVTAYTGASRFFAISPPAASVISAAGAFDFDESALRRLGITSGVNTACALSESVQDVILELAEAQALKSLNAAEAIGVERSAYRLIDGYNAQYDVQVPVRFDEIVSLTRGERII